MFSVGLSDKRRIKYSYQNEEFAEKKNNRMRKEEKLTIVSWKEAMSNTKCQKVFTYITFSLTKWQIIKQNLNIKFLKNPFKYINIYR